MKRYALVALTVLLCGFGCTTPQTPQQAVFQAQTGYVTAAKGVNVYLDLPRCSASQSAPCSDPAVVEKIKLADLVAYTALKDAEKTVRDPGTDGTRAQVAATYATGAIKAFVDVTAIVAPGK